jgi:hypothetical protein
MTSGGVGTAGPKTSLLQSERELPLLLSIFPNLSVSGTQSWTLVLDSDPKSQQIFTQNICRQWCFYGMALLISHN